MMSDDDRLWARLDRLQDTLEATRRDMTRQHRELAGQVGSKIETLEAVDAKQDVRITSIETGHRVGKWVIGTLIALASVAVAIVAVAII